MTRAEQKALKAYPIQMSEYSDNCKQYDSNESDRLTYQEGYKQAEKDTIERADQWFLDIFGQFDITDSNGYSIDISTFRRIFRETMEK